MPFAIGGSQLVDEGYQISNSIRFNDDDNPEIARTPSSASNRRTWTWSCWIKRSTISAFNVWGAGSTVDNRIHLDFNTNGDFQAEAKNGGSEVMKLSGTPLLRDVSAWYNIVWRVDTTQSTSTDRVRVYVNGTQVTFTSSTNFPSQNLEMEMNNTSPHKIGLRSYVDGNFMDGYMSEVHFVDGSSLAPTTFAETDDNGVWIPKDCKNDITYGTNGFYLEFKQTGTSANSSGMGADTSGQDNHFDLGNLTATDITTDTPTNNFATWNSLHKASNVTLSEGNCKAAIAGSGQSRSVTGTIAVSRGKWYWEIKYTSDNVSAFIGLVSADIGWNINDTTFPSSGVSDNVGFNDGGTKYVNGSSSSYGSGFGNNDIIGVEADLDNNEVVFFVNGTAQNSGTPISKTFSGDYFLVVQHQSSNGTSNFELNTGNPTFTGTDKSDAEGFGSFEYTVPSGHFALCTKNLAEYG